MMQENRNKLIAFAAEKVGEEIYYDANIGDQPRYFGTEDIFDLTSPELLLKGLGVAGKRCCISILWNLEKQRWRVDMTAFDCDEEGRIESCAFGSDLSTTFWQCWAELKEAPIK